MISIDGWYVSIARLLYWHHGGVASAIARARFPRCQLLTGFEVSNLKTNRYMDLMDKLGRMVEKVGRTLVISVFVMTCVLLASFLIGALVRWLAPSLEDYVGIIISTTLVVALVWYASTGKDE